MTRTSIRTVIARAALVVALVATAVGLPNGARAGTLDQQQTTVDNYGGVVQQGGEEFQTFTPAITGQIDQVDVNLEVDVGGCDLDLEIRPVTSGVVGTTVLGEGALSRAALVNQAWNVVILNSLASVTAGTQYAIAARISAPATCASANANFFWGMALGNTYLPGAAIGQAADADFAFKTYVNPVPSPMLTSPANGSTTSDTTPTFSGTADREPGDDLTQVTVEVYQGTDVTGTPVQTLTADPNDATGFFTVTPTTALAPGTYVARVLQNGTAGTGSGNQNIFAIEASATASPGADPVRTPALPGPSGSQADTSAPDTFITSEVIDKTRDRTPTFNFASNETTVRFECAVDGGAFAPCSSTHTLTKLKRGDHTLSVRAIDAAGNADPSPATELFTVKKRNKKKS